MTVSSLVNERERKISKERNGIVSTVLKKGFQLSFRSVRASKTKRSAPGSRCLEINCPDSEELFNESKQLPSVLQFPLEAL